MVGGLNMGFLTNEFPNSDYYQTDLRELIRLYKELQATYNNLQNEIQEAIDYINNFQVETDKKIQQEITIAMANYTQRLIAVENLVKALEEELKGQTALIPTLQAAIEQLRHDIVQNNNKLLNLYNELLEQFHEYKNNIDKYVDDRMHQFENYIYQIVTKLDRLDVINPFTGKYEDINKVLFEIFNAIQLSFGITAGEYDKLQLTAGQYDRMRIKAGEYSTKAYFIFWELRQGQMRDPFTGRMNHYSNIIYKLTNLHKCTYTAKQYDDLHMTAQEFDAWMINAFNYDWFARQLIYKREGITAGTYDKLELTASEFDDKKMTAIRYDLYGNQLLTDPILNRKACACMACNPDVLQTITNK